MEKELSAVRQLARERQQKISFLNAVRIMLWMLYVYTYYVVFSDSYE